MNSEQFTNASQELINNAIQKAITLKNSALFPLHILSASLENELCRSIITLLGAPLEQLKQITDTELTRLPTSTQTQLGLAPETDLFFRALETSAKKMGDSFISVEQFLLELVNINALPETIKKFFKDNNITQARIIEQITSIRKGRIVNEKNAEAGYQVLQKYCQNITEQAREGKLDPVIGRHEEIRRVIQILSRRTKNNPVLVGPPGVGKTAIVEGIAQRIINNDVPETLRNKEVYGLDLGLLIAGAKYQGEFEERLKGLLKEIEARPDEIILFIDELHMLIGAGKSGSGGMDASNLLKPALARGQLHCIGATTLQEYKQYIEKDAALERRFQKVLVDEPSIEDAISILRGLKERYELHHGIHIKDQALVDAVLLASKNIPDRFLPDKAIDLVDEAAAMVKMAIDSHPADIDQLDRKIRQLEIEKVALSKEKDGGPAKERLAHLEKELSELKEKHQTFINQWKAEKAPLEKINKIKEKIETANYEFQNAEREGNFAKASEIKYGKLVLLEQELQKEQEKLKALATHMIKQYVDEHDIAKVLSRWTGIPVEKLESSETKKLLTMNQTLNAHVIGQEEAVERVSEAIVTHRAGLTDPNRPIGSFMFLGPTGVGKTEVARSLAEFLFNNPRKMIRIDMSEYMERHAVARLIGAPPGYVGYEEGGQLTEQVRRNPYSVVLFDEIEKAHPEVFNIFLQILDEGQLTDSQGRTVSFKNTIIIMTSNLGSNIILEHPKLTDSVKNEVMKLVKASFRPEFINRLDAIIFFKQLDASDIQKIAHIQAKQIAQRLMQQGVEVEIAPTALEYIAKEGYEPEFGARPLKRALTQYLITPLSRFILEHPDQKKIMISLAKDNSIQIH